jgi:uncharacterized protein (DUF2384 family)
LDLSIERKEGAYRPCTLAVELIGDAREADRWMHRPHRYLGGTPVDMLDTDEGAQAVEQSLYAVIQGGVGLN